MKIVLLQSNFAKALNQVSRVVGARTTLPVLSNVLLSAKKGKIRLSATDLEVGITTQTVGKIEEEGELTLPARLLSDFISNNKDESIEITTEGMVATLKSSHFEATIQGISAEEFPTVPEAPKEYYSSVKRGELADALKKVNLAAANDESRPALAGVFWQFDSGALTLAATDSYRLAEKKLILEKNVEKKDIIIPGRTMNEIARLLGAEEVEDVLLAVADNQVTFKVGDILIVSRLIEGVFPNYRQIIPTGYKTTVKAGLSGLQSAVKMSSLFAKDSANNNIKLVVDKVLTVVSSVSQTGSAKSTVDAEISGTGLTIAFNARYVLDVLSVIGGDKVIFQFNESSSAALIKSEKDENYNYIIMPLKAES
ncbi:MAG: DNA polymerase III subunit beta [Patescibacteria group bacterium]